MSKAWIQAKLPEFVRDLFRNFCQASIQLEEQFNRFDQSRTMDFEILKTLVGVEMDKGLLWRMKDTAHHVFRNDPEYPLTGQFLDWAMGYIFHETIKLKEDAYQKENYAPWFHEMVQGELAPSERHITTELFKVLSQTEESMKREIERIRFIMAKCRQLLPYYLERYKDNVLLARFIFSQNDLVRGVFHDEYDGLIYALYGDRGEHMLVLAGQSLRMGGWMEEASRAVTEALRLAPENKMVLQEKKIIDNWATRIKI